MAHPTITEDSWKRNTVTEDTTLVLVPEGIKYVNHSILSAILFLCGGVCFFILERFLGLRRREKPQFTAMLLDYVPESLALGGAFAIGDQSAPLLALLIGLQNIPEGFNAYRELRSMQQSSEQHILVFMFLPYFFFYMRHFFSTNRTPTGCKLQYNNFAF